MLTAMIFTGGVQPLSWEFPLEILVATMVFAINLRRRDKFWLRLLIVPICYFAFLLFVPTVGDAMKLVLPRDYRRAYSICWFALAWLLSLIYVWICFDVNVFGASFCGISGYCLQHLGYVVFCLLRTVFLKDLGLTELWMQYLVMGVVYVAGYFIFARNVKSAVKEIVDNKYLLVIGLVTIVVTLIMSYRTQGIRNSEAQTLLRVYALISCGLLLTLLQTLAIRKKLVREKEAIKYMWMKDREHYASQKEDMDLINIKLHDLKNKYTKFVNKETEIAMEKYDAVFNTGNEALDVVLTEKSYECIKNGVTMTCTVDGKKFNFMESEDIYSMFGNILDNAISAASKLDKENRQISLTVRSIGNLLSVSEENYYYGYIAMENGEIVSSNSDKTNHGFGVKSIKYVAKKYGGNVSIKAENGVFGIYILFNR